MKEYIRKFLLVLWLFAGLTSVPALAKDDDEDWWADRHDDWATIFFGDDGVPAGLDDHQLESWLRTYDVFYEHDAAGYSDDYDASDHYHVVGWHTEVVGYIPKWIEYASNTNEPGGFGWDFKAVEIRVIEVEKDADRNGVYDKIQDMDGDGVPDLFDPHEFDYNEPNSSSNGSMHSDTNPLHENEPAPEQSQELDKEPHKIDCDSTDIKMAEQVKKNLALLDSATIKEDNTNLDTLFNKAKNENKEYTVSARKNEDSITRTKIRHC